MKTDQSQSPEPNLSSGSSASLGRTDRQPGTSSAPVAEGNPDSASGSTVVVDSGAIGQGGGAPTSPVADQVPPQQATRDLAREAVREVLHRPGTDAGSGPDRPARSAGPDGGPSAG